MRANISSADDGYSPPMVTQYPPNKYSLRDTFSIHPSCRNIDTLFSTPRWKAGITLSYWLPDPNQIILRASHWRIDGFGLVMLSDVLLSILGKLVQNGLKTSLEGSIPEVQLASMPQV
jgi:hypothetical protein